MSYLIGVKILKLDKAISVPVFFTNKNPLKTMIYGGRIDFSYK
ncbi:hypothetical protein [Bacterioplanoides sp.]